MDPGSRSLALTCPGRRGGEFFGFNYQTADVSPRSRDTMCPSFASIYTLDKKRAQGKPDARCTRGLVCKLAQNKRTRAYRAAEAIRLSLRDALRIIPRSPRRPGFLATVTRAP